MIKESKRTWGGNIEREGCELVTENEMWVGFAPTRFKQPLSICMTMALPSWEGLEKLTEESLMSYILSASILKPSSWTRPQAKVLSCTVNIAASTQGQMIWIKITWLVLLRLITCLLQTIWQKFVDTWQTCPNVVLPQTVATVRKVRKTKLYRMSLYAIILQFPFTGTTRPKSVPA